MRIQCAHAITTIWTDFCASTEQCYYVRLLYRDGDGVDKIFSLIFHHLLLLVVQFRLASTIQNEKQSNHHYSIWGACNLHHIYIRSGGLFITYYHKLALLICNGIAFCFCSHFRPGPLVYSLAKCFKILIIYIFSMNDGTTANGRMNDFLNHEEKNTNV